MKGPLAPLHLLRHSTTGAVPPGRSTGGIIIRESTTRQRDNEEHHPAGNCDRARPAQSPFAGAAAGLSPQRLFPERTVRISDDWAGLLASGSNYLCTFPRQISWRSVLWDQAGELPAVVFRRIRPRLQRRDRDGFTPSSLFFSSGAKPQETPRSAPEHGTRRIRAALILTICNRISTVSFAIFSEGRIPNVQMAAGLHGPRVV